MTSDWTEGDDLICIGFGEAVIRMDGEVIYDGEAAAHRCKTPDEWGRVLTFSHAEAIARQYPDRKVEIILNGPFWGKTWEWRNEWVVTAENGGFA